MPEEFKGIDHGTSHINLQFEQRFAYELRPTEIHHKIDGALDNEPSFAIVMSHPNGFACFGQISLEMFNKALGEIGYKIEKK